MAERVGAVRAHAGVQVFGGGLREMVTGIEQYHFERAGYFVRRGLVSSELLAGGEGVPPAVLSLAEDLLGVPEKDLIVERAGTPSKAGWRRAMGPALDAPADEQAAGLGRYAPMLEARIALAPDDRLLVLPGTHVDAVTPEALEAIRAGERVAEAVRIRLGTGDCLFMSAALARLEEGGGNVAVIRIRTER